METPCVACRCVVLCDLQRWVLLTTYGGPPATPPGPLPPPRVTSPDCPNRPYPHRHNAYLGLAQVAMTRVLYRRYLCGQISAEEWAYRRRYPCRSFGPPNPRPYLDKVWFEGGGGEFVLAINMFAY